MSAEVQALAEDIALPFEDLFSRHVQIAASATRYTRADLLSDECPPIARAVATRESEFATGRVLARRLLTEWNLGRFPILRDADRVPIWPEGFVGSISHTTARRASPDGAPVKGAGLCLVVLGRTDRFAGLGVDVEPDQPVDLALAERICGARELGWTEQAGPEEMGRRCRLIFSAKEAIYKAFFPRIRQVWSFHDVELEVDLATGTFVARLPANADRSEVSGRFRRRSGWIATGVEVS